MKIIQSTYFFTLNILLLYSILFSPSSVFAAAPVISSVAAGTPGSATIVVTFNVNQTATSSIRFGTTTSYGSDSVPGATNYLGYTTRHYVTLRGLTPSTTYHYQVLANTSGQISTSTDAIFTTAAPYIAATGTPQYILQWGSYGAGNGQFNGPIGIAVDSVGSVYVADGTNNHIQKFTSDGTYITQWGSLGTSNGQFNNPTGIFVDSSDNVYVADQINYRIQKFTSDGTYIMKFGSQGSGNGQFIYPTSVVVDSLGNIYVNDQQNYRIQKFTSDGTYVSQWGSQGNGNGQFSQSFLIGIDPLDNIYVDDLANYRILKFTSDGTYITQWGSLGTGPGQFDHIDTVAVDNTGNVYAVNNNGDDRVQKFTSDGTYITQWGSHGSGDGQFNFPMGAAFDSSNNVYIVDQVNYRIQKFHFSVIDTVAPSLTSFISVPSETSSNITFNTNESATATISYGLTSLYGATTSADTLSTSHTFVLTTLSPSTAYHYQITATDTAGNVSTSSDQTFTTIALPIVATQSVYLPRGSSSSNSNSIPLSLRPLNETVNSIYTTAHLFTQTLSLGINDTEVKKLQKYLNLKGFIVSRVGPGSIGNETAFFGSATRAALVRFQNANRIYPAVGFFGPITRGFITKMK
ncbi:peptidoglycan-binding protein [Arenimonas sp.]|nr:peptidoglycan-binding protein [Candidatus Parcubacteria bacterium]